MNSITSALGDATTLFGVVTTLCVLVTGFFIGRRWLSRAGDGDIAAMKSDHDQMERDGL